MKRDHVYIIEAAHLIALRALLAKTTDDGLKKELMSLIKCMEIT